MTSEAMTVNDLDALDTAHAAQWFEKCCAAQAWCQLMVDSRPYGTIDQVKSAAQSHWEGLSEADFLQAFHAHPMIGDVNSLRAKYANTRLIASNEQSGANQASESTLEELSALNHQYLEQNGFIFIICATGLSADEMLTALKQRINNKRTTELANAAQEQIKITLLRIEKALVEDNRNTQ